MQMAFKMASFIQILSDYPPAIQMAFEYGTIKQPNQLRHLNIELVWYSDPHRFIILRASNK